MASRKVVEPVAVAEATGITTAGVVVAPALVRLLDAGGAGQGFGLLVGDREIVTCAHVVNLALGLAGDFASQPPAPVQLDFPFVEPHRRYTAEVVAWQPPGSDGSRDIAGLRLHREPPDGVVPCSLATVDDCHGHRFQVFGFTPVHDTGVWVGGEIRGPDLVGHVQLSGDAAGGPRLSPGFSGAPVWDEMLQAVVGIVSRATIGRTAPGGYFVPTSLLVRAWPEIEARTRPPCPYRGLLPMREVDAPLFFGREQTSARLAKLLPQGRFSLLVGPTGCGKSSVVQAGILPSLRSRRDLALVVCRPGPAPLGALVSALVGALGPGIADGEPGAAMPYDGRLPAVLNAQASESERAAALQRALDAAERERLFLVVDQFEELLGHPREVVDQVVGAIGRLAAASRIDGRPLCCIVLVVRGDFADQVIGVSAVGEALAQGREEPGAGIHHLLPMTTAELRAAVEKPVEQLRVVRYDDGLVDRLMRDIRRLDNPLAPLAFTLTQLWERQRSGRISLSAYEEVGEVAGAIRLHLDRVYDEELNAADRATARLLLLRLTAPDGRGGHVRRPARRDDLDSPYWEVAQRLAGRRMVTLLTAPDGTELVELVHDALLDEWPRLQDWLEEEASFLQWHDRLRGAMESWETAGRGVERLLDGAELAASSTALAEWGERLMSHEREFIERSRVFRRRARRVLAGAGIIAVLLVMAVVASVALAVRINAVARAEEDARASRDLAQRSSGSNVFTGLTVTLAAFRLSATPEAMRAVSGWYQRMALVERIRPADLSNAAGVLTSPDGQHAMAAWDPAGGMMLWDLERAPAPDITITSGREATGYAFTPDSSHVVYAESKQIVFWSVPGRTAERQVPVRAGGNGPVAPIEVAKSGTVLAYARGGSAYVVDARNGQILAGPHPAQPIPGDRNGFRFRFDASERYLSVVGAQQEWTVDLRSGRRSAGTAATEPADPNQPRCVTVMEGTNLTSGVVDIVAKGRRLVTGLSGACEFYGTAVDRGTGEFFLISYGSARDPRATEDPMLEIRSLADGTLHGRFPVPDGTPVGVVPSDRGARLVLRSGVEGYLLLRLPPPGSFARTLSVAESAAMTPDGSRTATLLDGTLSIWETRTGKFLRAVHDDRLRAVADRFEPSFEKPRVVAAPDGGVFASFTGGPAGHIQVVGTAPPFPAVGWALGERDGWKQLENADPMSYPSMTASFTSANEIIVWAGETVSRWDVTKGARIGDALRLPADRYDDTGWAARPGSPQFAVARQRTSIVEIWDFERGAVVTELNLEAGSDSVTAGRLAFNDDGKLLMVSRGGAAGVVVDTKDGATVATVPHFGPFSGMEGEPMWESDRTTPIAFLGARQVALDHWSESIYLWTWPRVRVPLLSRDDIVELTLPEKSAVDSVNVDRSGETVIYGYRDGWRMQPVAPERMRDSLCARLVEAGVDTELDNRPSC